MEIHLGWKQPVFLIYTFKKKIAVTRKKEMAKKGLLASHEMNAGRCQEKSRWIGIPYFKKGL